MIVRTSAELARLIDHTTLRSDVTAAEVEQYCQEAIEWNFASVRQPDPRAARRRLPRRFGGADVFGHRLSARCQPDGPEARRA